MSSSITYATSGLIDTLILSNLPYVNSEAGDGIQNSNLLTAAIKRAGGYEEIEGGLEAWEQTFKAKNSNGQWQGKNTDMKANAQDPLARLYWAWKIFTSSVVKNELEVAMNQGKQALGQYLVRLNKQAKISIDNDFNSTWWNATPGADEPDSIPVIVSTTPTVGTIGGLARSGGTYLQNGVYTTAITDIGSQLGIADMERLRITQAVGQSTPNLIIMDQIRYANLVAYLTDQKRYKADDEYAQLGFKTIELGDCVIGYENLTTMNGENTIIAQRMYGLNTKNLFVKRLKTPEADGWGKEFERIGKSLNKAVFYRWFGAMTTNNPRAHFVATNVSAA